VLFHLYALSLHHMDNPDHGHSVAVLRTMSPRDVDVTTALTGLEAKGLALQTSDGLWAPTELGRREAMRGFEDESGNSP